MPLLTNKKATARTPQIVTLIIDDSDSMREIADGGKNKAMVATESIQDMVMTTQANTQGSKGFRFQMNIAKYGDAVPTIDTPHSSSTSILLRHNLSSPANLSWYPTQEAMALQNGLSESRLGIGTRETSFHSCSPLCNCVKCYSGWQSERKLPTILEGGHADERQEMSLPQK